MPQQHMITAEWTPREALPPIVFSTSPTSCHNQPLAVLQGASPGGAIRSMLVLEGCPWVKRCRLELYKLAHPSAYVMEMSPPPSVSSDQADNGNTTGRHSTMSANAGTYARCRHRLSGLANPLFAARLATVA